MSHLVSRILLAILMFPLATVFYIIVLVMGEHWIRRNLGSETYLFIWASLITWGVVAVYWCLLWKSSVKWNSDRILFTFLAAIVAVFVSSVVGMMAGSSMPNDFPMFIGGILAIILWLIGTVLIWRETPAERAKRLAASPASAVSCPTCGYNLTGLTETRCPECGSKFTINELLASQPTSRSEID